MNSDHKNELLHILQTGKLKIEGVLPWSSNYSFLVTVADDGMKIPAVYKPRRGERPLWDFPAGTLHLRESAAYIVSEAIGWNLVPPTVVRHGEYGPGSVQLFIEHDANRHYFALEGDPSFRGSLQKMALLDVAINNADRKGGHVIVENKGNNTDYLGSDHTKIWGIDHGICFHEEYKLRTVIWEFAGESIPLQFLNDLQSFQYSLRNLDGDLYANLAQLLNKNELIALTQRIDRLVADCVFPNPGPGRHYPWPPV